MRNLSRLLWIAVVWCALCGMRAEAQIDPQAEKGDAVFRDLANPVPLLRNVGHTAIYYGYYVRTWPDNQYHHTVIQASGTGTSSSTAVDYRPFDDESYPPTFMGGLAAGSYFGAGNRSFLSPATWNGSTNSMSVARRDAIITEAQYLIGTAYCWYNIWDNSLGLDGTVSCEPRSASPTYPTYIRCDGVVQWVYERVGFNMGDRYTSYLDASPYPIDRMARFYAAYVDTPSTILQDSTTSFTITTSDNSSTPTRVEVIWGDGSTGMYLSPITKNKITTATIFYRGVDLANHKEAWKQFSYSPPSISVTVQPNSSGRSFTVDGTPYTTAQTFSWVSGSGHTIATSWPQSGGTGIQYVWSGWSDGGAISHTVAPTVATTYTANFTTQYYLTMGYGTGGSSVSPGSEWCNSGASVGISATAASGYSFSSWTGSGTGSYSGSSASPSITMNGPITELANFTTYTSRPSFGGSSVSGGKLQATLSGLSAGQTVVIYSSTDLKNWTPIQTNNVVSGSTFTFTNAINPAIKSQFFRATVQ